MLGRNSAGVTCARRLHVPLRPAVCAVYCTKGLCLTSYPPSSNRCRGVFGGPAAGLLCATHSSLRTNAFSTARSRLTAEYLVDLPLAYFVPPISTTPGQLPLILDLQDKR